ncbi:MAG: hypothetical protein FWD11_06830, partial [Micrococcales bacterium]|nr:hypothetical protein [Micrococcales bacterium]
MTSTMDETFAQGLRVALVERVQATKPRRSARWRWLVGSAAAGAVLAVGGGIAFATSGGLLVPGGDTVTPLADTVSVTGRGTQTVDLGTPPEGTTGISITLTCLTPGTFVTDSGAGLTCDQWDVDNVQAATWIHDLRPWQAVPGTVQQPDALPLAETRTLTTITITTTPDARWHLDATYSSLTTTDWGVNAHGQT